MCLGPEESHSVHKLRTTKIVVEEAASSPEICGTFTFSASSRKSEISVEEVGSFTLNAPFAESVISAQKESLFNAIVEETESKDDLVTRKMSRGVSIVSVVSEDDKSCAEDKVIEKVEDVKVKVEEKIKGKVEAKALKAEVVEKLVESKIAKTDSNDDIVEKLMQRINRQRSALDDNLQRQEVSQVEEPKLTAEITEKKLDEVTKIQAEAPKVQEEKSVKKEALKAQKSEEKVVKIEEKVQEEKSSKKSDLSKQQSEDKKIEIPQKLSAEEKAFEKAPEKALETPAAETLTKSSKDNKEDVAVGKDDNAREKQQKVSETLGEEKKIVDEVVAKDEVKPEGTPTSSLILLSKF